MFLFIIDYNFKINSIIYVSSIDFIPVFDRTEHISQIKTEDGQIECDTIIPSRTSYSWALRLVKV